MKVRVVRSRFGWIVTFFGVPALIVLVALFALPYMLKLTLSPEEAEKRVRHIIMWELSQRHAAILKEKGLRIPGRDLARQLKEEMDRVKGLEVASIQVKRPLPDPLFNPVTPTYVVRIVFSDGSKEMEPRYFWLSWSGVDREITRTVWFFSI